MSSGVDELVDYVRYLPYLQRRRELASMRPPFDRFVYKYRTVDVDSKISVDRLRDILVRSRLWLSSPQDFNDPFDMSARVVVDGTRQELRQRLDNWLQSQGMPRPARRHTVGQLLKESRDSIAARIDRSYRQSIAKLGVHSFGGDPKSILMWSHYAREHTGVCVQFEPARDFFTFSKAVPVEYSSQYPVVNWVKNFTESLKTVVLRKHEGWAYEKERRIVQPDGSRRYLSFDSRALVGLIIGCRASDAIRKVVDDLIEERRVANMPGITVYGAIQHRFKYQLMVYQA